MFSGFCGQSNKSTWNLKGIVGAGASSCLKLAHAGDGGRKKQNPQFMYGIV